ncbi:hypothetical protein [Spirulina sp. 06S082]|uniref:hypothetical protein n=1 Tax=Spirulina sp. 06S082 TaxID=3110248 RepID=UPI002B2081D4|nr:hypothetical protein [Spirulina sp. 06S082]MEA5467963.1 hypothetical protein [Spirulina sp. 06S082]
MKFAQLSLALVAGITPIAFSLPLFAQTHPYPANSRATFLSGCILDPNNAPDFTNREAVSERVEACVCLLDKFQQSYSNEQFTALFTALEQGDGQARKEMGDFFRNNVPSCVAQINR